MLNEAGREPDPNITRAGQLLDRHYIPKRYPDAYAEGSPHKFYDDITAKEAQDAAAGIGQLGTGCWVQGAAEGARGAHREARTYAARVRSSFPQAHVFLYGSVFRGNFDLHSDIDLLVVADLPAYPLTRAETLYRYVQGREEAKGLTSEEFSKLNARGKLEYLTGALEL